MKKIYLIATSLLIVFSSCDDLLDTEPNDRLTNEVALADFEGALATLLGGYDRLRNYVDTDNGTPDLELGNLYYRRDFIVTAEALADNLKQSINNSARLDGISINLPYAHFTFWAQAYRVISSANFVISTLDNIVATPEQLDQLNAEALFLRALAHFDLMRAYARNPNFPVGEPLGVPIMTEVPSPTGSFPERATIDAVYNQIITDLKQASSLINDAPTFPNRASDLAIQALLSRVQLYAGNWQEAIDAASYVIDNAPFDLETIDYTQIFSGQSETIFGISFLVDENPGQNGSLEGILFIDEELGVGYGDFVVRNDLLNLHEPGDIRASLYTSTTKSGEDVTYSGKYRGYGGAFGLDHIPLIRLSEMYLTRAEAKAELGNDLNGAIQDLDRIRNRAGLANTTATTASEIIEATLLERRIELAFEGHRFFDLKRKGMDIPKGTSVTDCQTDCLISYTDFRVVANIPVSETDVNDNLQQNPGY